MELLTNCQVYLQNQYLASRFQYAQSEAYLNISSNIQPQLLLFYMGKI